MLIEVGKIQDYGIALQKYPNICGTDVAGEIYEVGEDVTNFEKGDRVIGFVLSLMKPERRHTDNNAKTCLFPHYQ
jgi:NADPH:quinone reductase-like Zn-dependent oxidoreductase